MAQLNIRDSGDVVVVDIRTAKLVDETVIREIGKEFGGLPLEAAAGRKLVMNFQNVEFMSSVMIGHLVKLNRQCKADKIRLKLCSIRPEILEVFTITKLNKVFDICNDETSALESFGKRGWFSS